MAQKPQIIDITRSYIPGDPNAFPENLVGTQREDGEEKAPPISIFEGYNFLPTSYGYKSYFGTSSALDVPVVPARAQFILSYQSSGYINNLIALCEDGIWIIDPTADTNVWKHVVTHTFDADVFEEWTWCIIENAIYCYKQGGASVYHTSDIDDVPNGLSISIITEVPTFLNMAGQMGIFKAGTRLGFWDSANSVAWSSNLVLTDFTPSLENLAGNTIFGAVIGRITHVREHGEGFVVYSTKSIVGVSYDATSNLLWDAHTITAGCGVAVGREVTMGSSNSEHFAYTTSGMYRIGGYNGTAKQYEFQQVAVELSDFLKESREPIYLDCIEGRYLYIHCINSDYINGKVSFESFTVDLITIDIIPDILPSKIPSGLFIKKMQKIERDTMDQTYGDTLVKYSADGVAFDVVEWEVSYKTISPLGLAEKYEEPSVGASFAYADAGTLDRTSTGGANRTATAGVFVDAAGKYGSLEQAIVLPTLADFTARGTSAEDDFAPKVSGLLLYQDDALGGTLSPSYLLQKALPVEPSYLPLVGASSLGMIEGLYNVESLWKDFEKRQGAAVDRFTEIVDGLEDQSWSAYSTSGALEATIETPILSAFDLYKPRGCVGVQKQGKGFFFYKQYREIFDCTIASTRTMEALTEHKMVGESSYTTGVARALEDSVEVTINVASTDYTTIVTSADPHSPTFLRDLQVDSEINPIYFSVPDVYITLRPYDYYNQLLTTPWSAAGTTVVQSYSEQLPGSDISAVLKPLQTLTLPGDYVIVQPEAAVQFKVQKESAETHEEYPYLMSPMGSAEGEAFPNPGAYPITVSVAVGGSWIISSEYVAQIIYCIVDSVTGEASEYIRSSPLSNTLKINVTIPVGSALPSSYVHRVIVVYDQLYNEGAPLPETTRRFYYKDFIAPGSYVINDASETTETISYPASSINTTYNVHIEALSSVGWSVGIDPGIGLGHWYIGTTDFWIATLQNGALSEPTFIGSFVSDGSTWPKATGPLIASLPGTTYIYINHPDEPDPPSFPYYGRYLQRYTAIADVGGFASLSCTDPGFVTAALSQFPDYSIKNVSTWATSSPSTIGDLLAYFQSFEQSYLSLSNYARYLQAILAFDLTPTGKQIRPSLDMAEYRIVNAGDYLELWCDDILEAFNPHPVSAVLALLHQNSGFIYQYDVDEQLYGSIIDNQTVELTGAALVPTLDTEGVYNTLGGFFSPKNKISCTMTAGVLTQGAVTAIDDYTANEAEISDFLQPANELFLTDKYLLPPTYDEGERWYLVESADVIYETGTPFHHKEGLISSITTPVWSTLLYLPDYAPYDIPADDAVVIIGEDSATLPGATFNLQVGAPAPSYPTFTGAYVFDLHLKKWGKMKASYKHIFPFAPLNSNASGAISFTNFGMDCGVVLSTGVISLFDVAPADSYIRFGKLGYYRLGMTNLLEVKGMFRGVFEGSVITDTSLDGRTLSIPLRHIEDFSNVLNVTAYPDVSGRWHTIKISGNYDLQYLELRGTIAGRR